MNTEADMKVLIIVRWCKCELGAIVVLGDINLFGLILVVINLCAKYEPLILVSPNYQFIHVSLNY